MGHWQHALMQAISWGLTLAVPTVVWSLLAGGLYQLIRDHLRAHARPRAERIARGTARPLAKRSTG